jgi:hypothetical protein
MSASVLAMSTKMAALEELLKEGEYEAPFGKVVITRSGGVYKIVIYVDERELGRKAAMQVVASLVGPYLKREQIA